MGKNGFSNEVMAISKEKIAKVCPAENEIPNRSVTYSEYLFEVSPFKINLMII